MTFIRRKLRQTQQLRQSQKYDRYLVVDYWLDFLFRPVKGHCHGNHFLESKSAKLSPWRSKTEWNIAILISKDLLTMIWLHRLKIWWTLVELWV